MKHSYSSREQIQWSHRLRKFLFSSVHKSTGKRLKESFPSGERLKSFVFSVTFWVDTCLRRANRQKKKKKSLLLFLLGYPAGTISEETWTVLSFSCNLIGTFCLRSRGNSSRTVIQITLLKYWKPITTLNSVSSKGSLRHHHDRQQQQHFHRCYSLPEWETMQHLSGVYTITYKCRPTLCFMLHLIINNYWMRFLGYPE